jgi:L-rhamnose mutarotase
MENFKTIAQLKTEFELKTAEFTKQAEAMKDREIMRVWTETCAQIMAGELIPQELIDERKAAFHEAHNRQREREELEPRDIEEAL